MFAGHQRPTCPGHVRSGAGLLGVTFAAYHLTRQARRMHKIQVTAPNGWYMSASGACAPRARSSRYACGTVRRSGTANAASGWTWLNTPVSTSRSRT